MALPLTSGRVVSKGLVTGPLEVVLDEDVEGANPVGDFGIDCE